MTISSKTFKEPSREAGSQDLKAEGILKAVLEITQKLRVKARVPSNKGQVLRFIQEMQAALELKLKGERDAKEISQDEFLAMVMDSSNFTPKERSLIHALLQEAEEVKKQLATSERPDRKSKKYRSTWVQG